MVINNKAVGYPHGKDGYGLTPINLLEGLPNLGSGLCYRGLYVHSQKTNLKGNNDLNEYSGRFTVGAWCMQLFR